MFMLCINYVMTVFYIVKHISSKIVDILNILYSWIAQVWRINMGYSFVLGKQNDS